MSKKNNFKVGDTVIDTSSHGYETFKVTRAFEDDKGDMVFDVQDSDGNITTCLGCTEYVKATKKNIKRYDKRVRIGKKLCDNLHTFASTIMNQVPDLQKQAAKMKFKQRQELEDQIDNICCALVEIRQHYKVD